MEQPSKSPLTILIIAKYDPTFDWIQQGLHEQNYNILGRVDTVEEGLRRASRTHVDIILADTTADGVLQTNWIQKIAIQSPESLVLVSTVASEMDFVRNAMLAGAQGFLLKPFELSDLYRSIEQVHQLWLERNNLLGQAKNRPKKPKAHTISLFSPKGGTGVTTLAVNLAIALKQKSNAPILLIDADLGTADVDVFLNVYSEYSLLDLIRLDQAVDRELLNQVITEHNSGIKVLQGDSRLQFLDAPIDPGQMSDLIEDIKDIWDGYIVINTGNSLDRWTIEILDVADKVLLTTVPELPALRAVRNFLELAEAQNDESDKWQLVMNAFQNQKALRMSDIEESIRFPIKVTITKDQELVADSINRGSPFLVSHSKSNIAKDILALAGQLVDGNPSFKKSQAVKSGDETMTDQPKRKRFSVKQLFTNTLRITQKAEQTAS